MNNAPPRILAEPLRLVEVEGTMPHATNATLLARDADGHRWVYKPEAGETPLWDFPWKSLAAREVLSYEVSEVMGLGIIPLTVIADGPYGPGSAQIFLEEDFDFDPRPLFRNQLDPCLWPFAVFDLIANNADRKIGHFLRQRGTGKLWGIDNGLTFHWEDKLRTVLWGFGGTGVPADLVVAVEKLAEALGGGLTHRIASLLSRKEAEALEQRVEHLLERPVHPQPPDDRPALPWPVW